MERLVAKNTYVDLTPGPGVTIDDTIGFPRQLAGHATRVSIGDLSEGQVRDIIVRVKLAPHHAGSKVELLDATAHYTPAAGGVELIASKFLGLEASSDAKAIAAAGDPDVAHQAARVRVADALIRAIAMARGGDVKSARALLDEAATIATTEGKRFEDPALSAKATEAQSLKKTIASLAPPPPPPQPVLGNFSPPQNPGLLKPMPMAMPAPPITESQAFGLRAAHADARRELDGN